MINFHKLWKVVFSRTFIVITLLFLQASFLLYIYLSMRDKLPYAYTISTVLALIIITFILNKRINSSFKLLWIIFVAILPIFGALFYVFMQTKLETRKYIKNYRKQLALSRKYSQAQPKLLMDIKENNADKYKFLSYMSNYGGMPIHSYTDAHYFSSGQEKFDNLIEALKSAEKFIFMEYYIVEYGYMWSTILDILKEKVKEGVEVRFLYDGTCSFYLLPYNYYKELESYGIQCRVFSQIIPAISSHQNNRDHRKIAIIDGVKAFTGGVNLADEYINKKQRFGFWKDAAMMITGDAVKNFTVMFLQMWHVMGSQKEENEYDKYIQLSDTENLKISHQGYVLPYNETPLNDEIVAKRVYMNMINSAHERIYVMTPYLILDDQLFEAFIYAAKRGVDVRIIMPNIFDKKMVHYVALTYYESLIQAGVKIYHFTPGFIHSKVVLKDTTSAVVGTINMDFRSLYLNFECAIYLYKHQVIKDIEQDFCDTFTACELITLDYLKTIPIYQKIAGAVLKVFAPLL